MAASVMPVNLIGARNHIRGNASNRSMHATPEGTRIAALILTVLSYYLCVGAIFGIAFAWRGADRIDPAIHGAPARFRLLILPGAIALWPILALHWRRAMLTRGPL